MCEWCEKYGDGYERWYFNPANYARRLYKIRREETEASGAEANPQAAGGMAVVGHDFLEARERGDVAMVEAGLALPCKAICLASFEVATTKTSDNLNTEMTKTLSKDGMCEFTFSLQT